MIDVHSHILPALDDGVRTLDEAVEVIRGIGDLGFSHMVATSHFYPGRYTPSLNSIDVALAALRETLKKKNIPVELIRGRECFFDFELTTAPERESFPFEWNGRRYQLIELPQMAPPAILAPYVKGLLRSKITPILAHIERYNRVIEDPERVEEYSNLGFKIQVDLLSLHDTASEPQRTTAEVLLKSGKIDLLASDVHKPAQLERIGEVLKFLRETYDENRFQRFFSLS